MNVWKIFNLTKLLEIIVVNIIVTILYADFCSASPLYIVRGTRGTITFTNKKPEGNFQVFTAKNTSISKYSYWWENKKNRWTGKPIKSDYDDEIKTWADFYELDYSFVKAVVHIESNFNPLAKSPKGAMGLMQLMPGTATRFGALKPYHPKENIKAGSQYLKWLLDRYEGNSRLALAAYNAGEGNVDKSMSIPPFPETVTYVSRVMRMAKLYQCESNGKSGC